MKLTADQSAVKKLYSEQGRTGKKLMQHIFGEEVFKERPLGVWCLTEDSERIEAKKWDKAGKAQGVLVVTEHTAFIVAPHADVALQWGAMDKAKSALVCDKETFDSKTATDAMLKVYEGALYEDNDDKIWNVEGTPAAEWVRKYSHGNRSAGSWDLPTIAQLKIMHEFRNEINDCLIAMGGYKLVPGWYWSSIAHTGEPCRAWAVLMLDGYVVWDFKYYYYSVRAVSAFQL